MLQSGPMLGVGQCLDCMCHTRSPSMTEHDTWPWIVLGGQGCWKVWGFIIKFYGHRMIQRERHLGIGDGIRIKLRLRKLSRHSKVINGVPVTGIPDICIPRTVTTNCTWTLGGITEYSTFCLACFHLECLGKCSFLHIDRPPNLHRTIDPYWSYWCYWSDWSYWSAKPCHSYHLSVRAP